MTPEAASTVVACIVCADALLISEYNLETITDSIITGSLGDVIFRCTICSTCDWKVFKRTPDYTSNPDVEVKFPIGTTMIVNWPTYKSVSSYLRMNCRLYSCNDMQHVVENRVDIAHSMSMYTFVHQFRHDEKVSLEPGNLGFFFRGNYLMT